MATKTLKTVSKISVKIWRPIIEKLEAKMETACLRRDAYLSKVLGIELDRLDHEVSIPNSQASYDYVFDRLDRLDRKLVSLALPSELTARLNDICSRKRIVRDAFFNRLFLLLAVEPQVVDALLFGDVGDGWRTEVWSENKNDGPFFQNGFYPLEPTIDPFWAIRNGLELYACDEELEDYIEPASGKSSRVKRDLLGAAMPEDSLYTIIFERKVRDGDLLGLSCYMPDLRVPGQKAEQEHRAKLDELLSELKALP
ncbi:hypothetical protein PQR68_34540 [Paraburkholderia agricolaris]|uniref:hypothetical protein n=1 Tax=Paraburkholderia agricolaris TaxID=2152888 RepID=UPI0038BBA0FC